MNLFQLTGGLESRHDRLEIALQPFDGFLLGPVQRAVVLASGNPFSVGRSMLEGVISKALEGLLVGVRQTFEVLSDDTGGSDFSCTRQVSKRLDSQIIKAPWGF